VLLAGLSDGIGTAWAGAATLQGSRRRDHRRPTIGRMTGLPLTDAR
jgi:hypothetical protein